MDKDFNMDEAVATIADGLDISREAEPEAEAPAAEAAPETPEAAPAEAAAPVVDEVPPPKSWAKEQHERWKTLDPEVKKYVTQREEQMLNGLEQYKEFHGLGKTLHDVINPYRPILEAQGVDAPKAVAVLLNAHYRLTNGTPESRMAAYQQLGQSLGLVQAQQGEELPPAVRDLMERQQKLESALTQREQARYQEAVQKTSADVNSFANAKDEKGQPLHPYFDEVADDIVVFIQAGKPLKEAYERAVYANPVTREKENARLQKETEAKLREKAKTEATAARKASSTNVKSRDTNRAPTGLMGTMEDTLKETLAKSRTH